jgi:hypothetical protein
MFISHISQVLLEKKLNLKRNDILREIVKCMKELMTYKKKKNRRKISDYLLKINNMMNI